MHTRYLEVVASLLIPKSVVLRLVLFRCPDPDTESIKTIPEATRENIRILTSKAIWCYGVYCRGMINYFGICQAQGIIQSLKYSGGFGPLGVPKFRETGRQGQGHKSHAKDPT